MSLWVVWRIPQAILSWWFVLLVLCLWKMKHMVLSYSEVVITLDFESSIPGSNPGKRIRLQLFVDTALSTKGHITCTYATTLCSSQLGMYISMMSHNICVLTIWLKHITPYIGLYFFRCVYPLLCNDVLLTMTYRSRPCVDGYL